MDKQIIESAVNAAAQAEYQRCHPKGPGLDVDPDVIPSGFRRLVEPIVAAALAEVETSTVVLPVIHCAHLGPEDTTGTHLRTMADRLGADELMGSNATAAAQSVLRAYAIEIDRIEQEGQ